MDKLLDRAITAGTPKFVVLDVSSGWWKDIIGFESAADAQAWCAAKNDCRWPEHRNYQVFTLTAQPGLSS